MNRYYYAGNEPIQDPFYTPNIHNINIGDEYRRNPQIVYWTGGTPAALFTVTSLPYNPNPQHPGYVAIDVKAYHDVPGYVDPVKWPVGWRNETISVDWLISNQPYYIQKNE